MRSAFHEQQTSQCPATIGHLLDRQHQEFDHPGSAAERSTPPAIGRSTSPEACSRQGPSFVNLLAAGVIGISRNGTLRQAASARRTVCVSPSQQPLQYWMYPRDCQSSPLNTWATSPRNSAGRCSGTALRRKGRRRLRSHRRCRAANDGVDPCLPHAGSVCNVLGNSPSTRRCRRGNARGQRSV